FLDLFLRYAALDLLSDQGAVALLAFVLGAKTVAGVCTHRSSLRTKTGERLQRSLSGLYPCTCKMAEAKRRPGRRSMCTIRWSESAMLLLMARYGSSISLWSTQVVKRLSAWAAELAWTVDSVPEFPVLSSCSKSKASPPRISPRMIRSGR